VLKTAHIPNPNRKPKFAFTEAQADNLAEVGEGSAGPEAGAEDEAEQDITEEEAKELRKHINLRKSLEKNVKGRLQKPMTFGSIDG
jgi:hypothetical protein